MLVRNYFDLFDEKKREKFIYFCYSDHKPEDPQERTRIEKAGYKVTLDGRVSGIKMKYYLRIIIDSIFRWFKSISSYW